MYETKNGLQNPVLIFGLILALLTLLFTRIGAFEQVYPIFQSIFSDFQISNISFFQNLNSDLRFFSDITSFRDQNQIIQSQNEKLVSQNTQLMIQIQDLTKITNQLSFNKNYRQEPVRITRFSNNQTEVQINKGKDYQINVNDIAVIDNNLVGIVTQVTQNSSLVRLINDQQSKVPAVVLETNSKGLLNGQNSNEFLMQDIPNNVKLDTGMTVVSAGTDGVVPYGLSIGKVVNVNTNLVEITQVVVVKSTVKFNDLRDLFILIK